MKLTMFICDVQLTKQDWQEFKCNAKNSESAAKFAFEQCADLYPTGYVTVWDKEGQKCLYEESFK